MPCGGLEMLCVFSAISGRRFVIIATLELASSNPHDRANPEV